MSGSVPWPHVQYQLYHEILPYRPLDKRYRALLRYGKAGDKGKWVTGEYFTRMPSFLGVCVQSN